MVGKGSGRHTSALIPNLRMRIILDTVARVMRAAVALACIAALAIGVAACGSGDHEPDRPGPRVVATTTQLADIARSIAGDRATVTGILTPNSDPHDYEPRPGDARALADAGLVLQSGGDVDAWLGDLVKSAGADARVVTLIDDVHTRKGEGGEVDPHWWQDPRNTEIAVRRIRDALARADGGGTATYDANAETYLGRLESLDAAIARCMDAIPAGRRRLVTNHDALGYFADRYGIDVVGAVIPALSTAARASAGETRRLVDTIRREHVSTIFPESSVNPKLEQAIAADAGAKVGPALWADSLGPRGSTGATYLGSIWFNAESMAEGFTDGATRCPLPD
jgi:ABC-type Zn uptake system ZnuABC Zn-binding protein ZnuA